MKKKILVRRIHFKEQTPEIFIGKEKEDPIYEKAFFDREEDFYCEFCQNTTTWD